MNHVNYTLSKRYAAYAAISVLVLLSSLLFMGGIPMKNAVALGEPTPAEVVQIQNAVSGIEAAHTIRETIPADSHGNSGNEGNDSALGGEDPEPPSRDGEIRIIRAVFYQSIGNYTYSSGIIGQCAQYSAGIKVTEVSKYVWRDSGTDGGFRFINRTTAFACVSYASSIQNVVCAVEAVGSIEMIAPNKKVLASGREANTFTSEGYPVGDCTQTVGVALSAKATEFGQYKAVASTYKVPITYKLVVNPITAQVVSRTVTNVGNVYLDSTKTAQLQVTCGGLTTYFTSGNSWDYTDCSNEGTRPPLTPTPMYECVADSGLVSINGQATNTAELFRNGEDNEITWVTERPSGITIQSDKDTTRFVRDVDGTPWRENGVSVNKANFALSTTPGGNQLFTSDTATSWVTGQIGTAYVRGYWASTEGAPTEIHPTWSYGGTATVKSYTIAGFDGNNWVFNSVDTVIDATAACNGETINLSFLRGTSG